MQKKKKMSNIIGPVAIRRDVLEFVDRNGTKHSFPGNIHVATKSSGSFRTKIGMFAMRVPEEFIIEFCESIVEPGYSEFSKYREFLFPSLAVYAEHRHVPDYKRTIDKCGHEPFIAAESYDALIEAYDKITERIASVRVAEPAPVTKVILIEAMTGTAPGAFCGVNSKGYLGQWKPSRPNSIFGQETLNGMPFLGMLARYTIAYKHNDNFFFNKDLTGDFVVQRNTSAGMKYLELPWSAELEAYMADFVAAVDKFGVKLFDHLESLNEQTALEAGSFKMLD